MKTRIGTSFGFALLLAVGVFATMLALGMFSTAKVSANPGAVTIPSGGVTNTPDVPGDGATYTIRFQPAQDLVQGNSLYVLFDSAIGVPSSMERERVTISASGGGTSNPLSDPEISTNDDGDTVVKVTLGDTNPGTSATDNEIVTWGSEVNSSVNTGHILTFSTLAGITNSTSPSETTAWVKMSDDGVTYGDKDSVEVYSWLKLNDTSDKRGKALTLTGKGWKSGTATVFIDMNHSRTFESGTDKELGQSDAAISGGAFTASFTADTNFSVGANSINVIDGVGNTAGDAAAERAAGSRYTSQKFTLTGNASLSASSAARGESVTVTVADFGGSTGTGNIESIKFGSAMATLPSTVSFTNNTGTFAVTVPSTTPLGSQTVTVASSSESNRTTSITIAGLAVTASPSTAVANQAITVSGSGFTGSTDLASITVGGQTVSTLTDSTSVTDKATDNSGNLVATFKVPTDETTRTPGEHKVIITDDSGRIGEVVLTVPSRTLTLDPTESRRGSTITFTGTGYQGASTVSLTYGSSSTPRTTVTAASDGDISGSFTVGTTIGIPSTNTVTATISCTASGGETCTETTGTATHKVPAAAVTVEPTTAASGEEITVTGAGFPGYVSLTSLTIATVTALPTPAPATDGDGNFTLTALVPQLGTGSQALLVTAGSVTATTSFTVGAAAVVVEVSSDLTETLFADEITADNLVRVWNYDNETGLWSFYDPRPAFASANDYTDTTGGDIVWVNVTAETTFQGSTLYEGWNLIALD